MPWPHPGIVEALVSHFRWSEKWGSSGQWGPPPGQWLHRKNWWARASPDFRRSSAMRLSVLDLVSQKTLSRLRKWRRKSEDRCLLSANWNGSAYFCPTLSRLTYLWGGECRIPQPAPAIWLGLGANTCQSLCLAHYCLLLLFAILNENFRKQNRIRCFYKNSNSLSKCPRLTIWFVFHLLPVTFSL